MFQYKTRGTSSPQGKRRVYFTCHPEDFERFFEEICGEVLKISDCSVWYSGDEGYEDIETDLGQMNLLVVPVTARLLTKPCRTMDLDVPFALEKHIPILPLMQESGLDELFSRKFGDLQYLDKNARDETAISYGEKLKKYLTSVLIGDKLAARVRAAFDAWIFLSYRKKDRKYANELMRLIHQNDFCRDIAIWYDEYLTPGENFNDAISDALAKSDLFALVVTPNLVNEINYVQTVEYPAAAAQNKAVLPARMEETDASALSEQYPGIPASVDAKDGAALSEALRTALAKVARTENDSDPAHNFLIGLAYLDGIDVEVDHERAFGLIHAAAEADLPEAIQKLVSMYSEGHGVGRDYRTAARWQQRLAEHWEAVWQASHERDDYIKLLSALWGLGNQLYALRDLDAAEQAYGRMRDLCNGIPVELANRVEARLNLSISYEKLGDIRRARGDLAGAEEQLRKALALYENPAEETGSMNDRRDLAIIYNKLGDIRRDRGDPDGGEEFYRKTLALFERLAEEAGTAYDRHGLFVSLERIGSLRMDRSDLDGAEELYRKAFALSEALAEEVGTVEARRDLSFSCERLGDVRRARNDLDGAEELYRKSYAIFERLAEETGTVEARRDLSFSYSKLGNLRKDRGDLDGSEELYRKHLALSEALAAETGTVKARRDLSNCHYRLGRICETRGDLEMAELHHRKALALDERLAAETGTMKARRVLSVSYAILSDIRWARGDQDGAEELYRKCLEVREQMDGKSGSVQARRDLAASHEKQGDLCKARGSLAEAEAYYRKARAVRERLAEKAGTPEVLDDLAVSCYKLAVLRQPFDRALLEKALQIWTALAEQFPQAARYTRNRNVILGLLSNIKNTE